MELRRYLVAFDTGQEIEVRAYTYMEAQETARTLLGLPAAKRRGGIKVKFCKLLD